MNTWGTTAMAESQMHKARHVHRLAKLLDELREQPVNSIPSACHG